MALFIKNYLLLRSNASCLHVEAPILTNVILKEQFTIDIVVRMENNISQHVPRSSLRSHNGCETNSMRQREDKQDGQKFHHVSELKVEIKCS